MAQQKINQIAKNLKNNQGIKQNLTWKHVMIQVDEENKVRKVEEHIKNNEIISAFNALF